MKNLFIIIALVAAGAFGWWTISPLFIDKVVEDELDPELAALLEESDASAAPVPAEEPVVESSTVVDQASSAEEVSETLPPAAATNDAVTSELIAEPVTPTPAPEPTSSVSGPFSIVDTPGHPATGNVRVIQTPEQSIVRYENYDGTNGPDLKVWLTNDLEATDFVSLGRAKGNQGNINYTVPANVDVDDYRYVITWCEAFGVLFDYAEIN